MRFSGRGLGTWLPIILIPPREPQPTPTPTPSPTPSPTPVLNLHHPKGLAVNTETHRLYVTGRDTNQLYLLDGATLSILNSVKVGREPWGVAVNPSTNKVYVGNYASGDVYVLDATTLSLLTTIHLGGNPTFVKLNPVTNRIFVVTYGNNAVAVINGYTDTVERFVGSNGVGAWSLAVNPNLNRIYVSNRDVGTVTTLDGNNNFGVIEAQTISPCGGTGASPYGLDFNPANNKLYISCAPAGLVDHAAVYQATATGLTELAFLKIGNGGGDGGGGVAVDTATSNVFFTNSVDNTVSVVSGTTNTVIATVPTGVDPFGAVADPTTKKVYIGNRTSDNISVIQDVFP